MGNAYRDYEWLMNVDLRAYGGQWVAVLDRKVVAHGKHADIVLEQARKNHPKSEPIIMKIRSRLSVL